MSVDEQLDSCDGVRAGSSAIVMRPLTHDSLVDSSWPLPSVWLIDVASYCSELTHADDLMLDITERETLARLASPATQDSYRAAHVGLRRLLALHLGIDPAMIVYGREACWHCAGMHGRPILDGVDQVHFSISRRERYALLAIASVRIGLDVEQIPAPHVAQQLMPELHPAEGYRIQATPDAGRPTAFARAWSRKEAYVKGLGAGLTRSLAKDDLGELDRPSHYRGWQIENIMIDQGHVGAVAIQGKQP